MERKMEKEKGKEMEACPMHMEASALSQLMELKIEAMLQCRKGVKLPANE